MIPDRARYHGQPMAKHLSLPIDVRRFDRCVALFEKTAREIRPPKAADHFVMLARRVAEGLELGAASSRGLLLGHLGVAPVKIWLLDQKGMMVVLAPQLAPLPRAAAKAVSIGAQIWLRRNFGAAPINPRRLVWLEADRFYRGRTFETSNELEARDLPLGLLIGPGRSDRRPHCRLVLGDAIGERSYETGAGSLDPRGKSRLNSATDHQVEFSDDLARLDQRWCARFDRRDRDGLRFRKQVPPDCHETRDRSGRRDPLKVLRVGLFGPSPAGRPLADDAERASKATRC